MSDKEVKIIIGAVDKFSGAFGMLESGLRTTAEAAGIMAGAATATGAAMFAMTKSTASTYDEVRKFSDQLGIGTEFISKMRVAAKFSGVEANTLDKFIQKLTVNLSESSKGTGMSADAFKSLGINVFNTSGHLRTAESIMPELADALNGVESATLRAELASKLFGQRGMEMLQITKDGSAGLRQMWSEAERLGLVISEDSANKAAQFGDSLDRMLSSVTGLKDAISVKLMPVFTSGFNAIAQTVADNRDKIVNYISGMLPTVENLAVFTVYSIAIIKDAWAGLGVIWDAVNLGFTVMSEYLMIGFQHIVDGAGWVIGTLNAIPGVNLDGAAEKVKAFSDQMGLLIGGIQAQSLVQQQELQNTINNTASSVEQAKGLIASFRESFNALTQGMTTGAVGAGGGNMTGEGTELGGDAGAAGTAEDMNKGIYPFNIENVYATESNMQYLSALWNDWSGNHVAQLELWYKQQKDAAKGNADRLKAIDQEYWNQKEKLEQQAHAQNVSNTTNFFSNLASVGGKFGETMFKMWKAQETARAIINTYAAYNVALASAPPPINFVLAAAALASGLASVIRIQSQNYSAAGAAHGGLDYVPKEQTYLLDRGERVLSPRQNQDLSEFMSEGRAGRSVSVNIEKISILENATNAQALLDMDKDHWKDIIEMKIVTAWRELGLEGAI